MASQLIESLSETFDPAAATTTTTGRQVRELIDRKARARRSWPR